MNFGSVESSGGAPVVVQSWWWPRFTSKRRVTKRGTTV